MTVEDVVTFSPILRYFRIGRDAAGVATPFEGKTLVMKVRWHGKQLLVQNASRSLGEIWEVVQRETTRYGDQQDDQTLMLVRVTA